jgi:hypothetical protein
MSVSMILEVVEMRVFVIIVGTEQVMTLPIALSERASEESTELPHSLCISFTGAPRSPEGRVYGSDAGTTFRLIGVMHLRPKVNAGRRN